VVLALQLETGLLNPSAKGKKAMQTCMTSWGSQSSEQTTMPAPEARGLRACRQVRQAEKGIKQPV